ncbi:MAG: hypothetical protein HOC20_05750 [Chloroflexi bacterium]|jgi:hypothetical protein|nr:hypothetical protein [Chloroflexota bacterium]
MSYQLEVVGSDTIDGKKCIIAEYNVAGAKTKMWLWEDNGIPLKMETVAPQGIMVVEYKSVDFGCAADSMFELPQGVPIMDMGEIPGMPQQ